MKAEKYEPSPAVAPRGHSRRCASKHRSMPRLAALSSNNDWYTWAGYKAPHSLSDEELEYFAIRSTAALFDISPMTKYRIAGPDAEAFSIA